MQKRMMVGKKRRKKHFPYIKIALGFLSIILACFIWLMIPYYQTIRYGICKTYVEMNVMYPQFLEFVSAEETVELQTFLPVVRTYYKRIGSFGEQILDFAECTFERDTLFLESVKINRERVHPAEDMEKIQQYNKTIPIVIAAEPDLASPPELPENLADYK